MNRARASSRWVALGRTRSRWASTIAPSAAVISSAEVTSKAKTYLVKSSWASEGTLPPAVWTAASMPVGAAKVTLPTPRASRTAKPRPATAAQKRCPLIVSTRESAESTPTSISTNRKSIMTAPV